MTGLEFLALARLRDVAAHGTRGVQHTRGIVQLQDLQAVLRHFDHIEQERARMHAILNTPRVDEFSESVAAEMAHQRARWAPDHDASKTPWDWFWLLGHLAVKASHCAVAGDIAKAKHHVITSAAALGNWYLALTGADTFMRTGHAPAAQQEQ